MPTEFLLLVSVRWPIKTSQMLAKHTKLRAKYGVWGTPRESQEDLECGDNSNLPSPVATSHTYLKKMAAKKENDKQALIEKEKGRLQARLQNRGKCDRYV